MITPELARQLKEAGLVWRPAKRDHFMVPGTVLADDVFTLNDQTILVQAVQGEYTIMFHGSAEWALDHVMVADVVWLPSETQLREEIQLRLGGDTAMIELQWSMTGFRCTLRHLNEIHHFPASAAEEAYGLALLFLLHTTQLE